MDKVSVIIPTYNRAGPVQNAINSALNQTYENIEIIVVDDNSSDNTEDLIKKNSDNRIIYIKKRINSGGPAEPRNIGLKISSGLWVAFLDSDDIWMPDKIKRQIDVMREMNLSASCTNAKINDETPYFRSESKELEFDDILKENKIICSSMVVKKEILEKSGKFPENIKYTAIEDYAAWLSCAMSTNVFYLKEILVRYNNESSDSVRIKNVHTENQEKIYIYSHVLLQSIKLGKIMIAAKMSLLLIKKLLRQ